MTYTLSVEEFSGEGRPLVTLTVVVFSEEGGGVRALVKLAGRALGRW